LKYIFQFTFIQGRW